MRELKLRKDEEKRIRRGYLWVFANQVADDLKEYEPGEDVSVFASNGAPLGSGTVSPHSLIAVRMHDRNIKQPLDKAFLKRKIKTAWARRLRWGYEDACRVVHGEADGLSGLIIDRLGPEIVAVQHGSAGMDRQSDVIQGIVEQLFSPKTIIVADDTQARAREQLPLKRDIIGEGKGELRWFELDEMLWPVDLDPEGGQKTGSYLDQAPSRRTVAIMAEGRSVLDAFSYTGGFGLMAAAFGATDVTLVDRSERALEIAKEAFKVNELPEPRILKLDLLKQSVPAKELGGPFDLVISDPPPLVKSRAKKAEGFTKTAQAFQDALSWTKPEGLAALFSCSHLATLADVQELVRRAARKARTRVTQLQALQAGPDHPVAMAHPETEYLHGSLVEVG